MYIQTYAHIHTHADTYTCLYTHTHTYIDIHTHTHARARAHTHTHTHMCVCVCVFSQIHTYIHTGMREIAIDFLERVLSLDVSNVLGICFLKKLNVFSAFVM
jgi:hypothetical protein